MLKSVQDFFLMMRIAKWLHGLILASVLSGGITHNDGMPHQHSEVHLVSPDIPNVREGGSGATPLPDFAEFITNWIPRRVLPNWNLYQPAAPWHLGWVEDEIVAAQNARVTTTA
jgi:hypothetical protein